MLEIADSRGKFPQRFNDILPNEAAHMLEGHRGFLIIVFVLEVFVLEVFDKFLQFGLRADHMSRDRCSEEFQAE